MNLQPLGRHEIMSWLGDWDRLLKSPHEVATTDNLANRLALIYRELLRAKKPFDPRNAGYKGVLITDLLATVGHGPTPIIELLIGSVPKEWAGFILEIKTPKVDPARAAAALPKILEAVRSPLIAATCLADRLLMPGDQEGYIRAYSELLAQNLLPLDDPESIQKLAHRSFSEIGLRSALAPHLSSLVSDRSITRVAWRACRDAWRVAADEDWEELVERHGPRGSEGAFSYQLLAKFARMAEGKLQGKAERFSQELKESLGRGVLLIWARMTVARILVRLARPTITLGQVGQEDVGPVQYSAALRRFLNNAVVPWMSTLRTMCETSPKRPSDAINALLGGVEEQVRDIAVDKALLLFGTKVSSQTARELGSELVHTWTDDIKWLEESGVATDSDIWKMRVRMWIARRDVQQLIRSTAETLDPVLAEAGKEACSQLATARRPAQVGRWWQRWLDSVVANTRYWQSTWRGVHWPALEGSAVRDSLVGMVKKYDHSSPYDVVFTLSGIDAQEERWTTDRVIWYSSAKMSIGEDAYRRLHSEPPDPSSLRAWIVVDAPSHGAAREEARPLIEGYLDTLTFALSVTRRSTGLKPSVATDTFVGSVEDYSSWGGGGWTREQMADVMNARDQQLIRYSRTYGSLLKYVFRPGQASELQLRFIRALSWYREGRWDPNPTTRFLTYYVAIEHVFTGNQQNVKHTFAEVAAKLVHSWTNGPRPERDLLDQQIERAVEFRKHVLQNEVMLQALDSDRELDGWREDIRPLLSLSAMNRALDYVGNRVSTSGESRKAATDYKAHLKAFTDWMEGTEHRREMQRERWRLRLHLMYERRNQIVHEAFTGGTDMSLYARTLESGVEIILMKLADLVLNLPGRVRTIDEALKWHCTPWE